jgi:endonuclease IV
MLFNGVGSLGFILEFCHTFAFFFSGISKTFKYILFSYQNSLGVCSDIYEMHEALSTNGLVAAVASQLR